MRSILCKEGNTVKQRVLPPVKGVTKSREDRDFLSCTSIKTHSMCTWTRSMMFFVVMESRYVNHVITSSAYLSYCESVWAWWHKLYFAVAVTDHNYSCRCITVLINLLRISINSGNTSSVENAWWDQIKRKIYNNALPITNACILDICLVKI